jgi:hypothetical protein
LTVSGAPAPIDTPRLHRPAGFNAPGAGARETETLVRVKCSILIGAFCGADKDARLGYFGKKATPFSPLIRRACGSAHASGKNLLKNQPQT